MLTIRPANTKQTLTLLPREYIIHLDGVTVAGKDLSPAPVTVTNETFAAQDVAKSLYEGIRRKAVGLDLSTNPTAEKAFTGSLEAPEGKKFRENLQKALEEQWLQRDEDAPRVQRAGNVLVQSLTDFPKTVAPGSTLTVNLEDVNWLKYSVEVAGVAYVREFSTEAQKDESETDNKFFALESTGTKRQQIQQIQKRYTAFLELLGVVKQAYQANYWPNAAQDAADREAKAIAAFGIAEVGATRFLSQPAFLRDELKKILEAASPPVLDPAHREEGNQLLGKLNGWITDTDAQKEVKVLAEAYVSLRTVADSPLLPVIAIPRDKDEIDVTVEYKQLSTYVIPPGQPAAAPPKFTTTLYIVPRFRITASVGPYVSGLIDHTFVVATADTIFDLVKLPTTLTPTAADSGYIVRQRIVQENKEQKWNYFGVAVLTHFEYRFTPCFGAALSLGAGGQASGLRGLLGGSLLFGNTQRVVLTYGVAIGQVDRLSRAYEENVPIRALSSSAVPTRDAVLTSGFFSISYNLSSIRK